MKRAFVKECLLHGAEFSSLFKAFDGENFRVLRGGDCGQAGTRGTTIEQDGAGSALAFAATILGSGEI